MKRKRSWCSSCRATTEVETSDLSYICCTGCGKVVAEDIYTDVVQFGKIVNIEPGHSASRERTLNKANEFITEMIRNMGIGDGDYLAIPSLRLYEIAVEKDFVRGRRAEQVAAACLYIICREKNRPFLLIEFSEYLRVNVYVLGAVFLKLCQLLHLQEHAFVRKLVDPSLFIHRFAHGLSLDKNAEIEKTALRIMTSMKRDWLQTGRKPSGLCGAALYISALSYGHKIPKSDVIRVVHICEATLNKRVNEFEGTESGSLTIEEFNQKAEEFENDNFTGNIMSKQGELLCEHKDSIDNRPHFAHGLCRDCYAEFITISGGLDGGSEPPAFQRAERAREVVDSLGGISETEGGGISETEVDESDKSDNLSDIDDAEVDAYLNNEEETKYKTVIWEKVNWEYLEEQARKTAAGGIVNVQKKPKKEHQQNKTTNGIAQTAADAAHQMLSKKRVSSKINHDRLKELFDEPVVSDNPKRFRTESFLGVNDEENEDDDESKAYEDYQDDPYDYNQDEYEEFDDGLY